MPLFHFPSFCGIHVIGVIPINVTNPTIHVIIITLDNVMTFKEA